MDDKEIFLTPYCNFVKEGNTIWTVLVKENVVVRCNTEFDTAEAVASFKFRYKGINGKYGYWFIDKYKDRLFINLTAESSIKILDTDGLSWEKIQISENNEQHNGEDLKFWTSFCHEGYYWKVGLSYPGIVKMDIETNQVTYINSWVEELKRICNSPDLNGFFGYGYCVREKKVFLPVCHSPVIMEMDMSTYECIFHKYPLKYKGFRVLSGDINDIWAETISGDLVRVDKDMCLSELKNTTDFSIKDTNGEAFWKPVISENKVLFFPHFYNRIFEVDKNTMEIKLSKMNDTLPGVSNGKVHCSEAVRQGDNVYFFYRQDDGYGAYCKYDIKNEAVMTKRFVLEDNGVQHSAWLLNSDRNIVSEDIVFDLQTFITAILNDV